MHRRTPRKVILVVGSLSLSDLQFGQLLGICAAGVVSVHDEPDVGIGNSGMRSAIQRDHLLGLGIVIADDPSDAGEHLVFRHFQRRNWFVPRIFSLAGSLHEWNSRRNFRGVGIPLIARQGTAVSYRPAAESLNAGALFKRLAQLTPGHLLKLIELVGFQTE